MPLYHLLQEKFGRKAMMAVQALVPMIAVAAFAFGVFTQGEQAKHAAAVACKANRVGDLGLVTGLEEYLAGGTRAADPDTQQFLVFLRKNADKVYADCIAQIH